MTSDDRHYFRARTAEERQRASSATHPRSRSVHLKMAQRYEAACGGPDMARQLRSSNEAIRRSRSVLSQTNDLISED